MSEKINEEIYEKDRSRSERRRSDVIHALRKRAKDRSRQSISTHDWYDNLHEYSKGKIHCSCPMCKIRTKGKKCIVSEPPARDKRKMQALEEEYKSLQTA